jgi:Na+/H+ antiporter NhaD/arsenite permease-like protein
MEPAAIDMLPESPPVIVTIDDPPRPGGRARSAFLWALPALATMVAVVTLATVFGERTDAAVTEPAADWLEAAKPWIALAVLFATVGVIATEAVHRVWCSLIGASLEIALMVCTSGAPDFATVASWIDFSTIGVLLGMMIIVGRIAKTGAFEVACAKIVRSSGGRVWVLGVVLMASVAFVSAWLDNVTTILVFAPIVTRVADRCGRDPTPLLLAAVFASNVGGAATMIGDPPALVIGAALHEYIGFVDFLANMAPGAIVAMVVVVPLVVFGLYRSSFAGRFEKFEEVSAEMDEFCITDWPLFAKSALVTTAVFVGFLLHPVSDVDPAWFALSGALVLCVFDRPRDAEEALEAVEWDLMLFFAGMFVAVAAAAELGTAELVAGWIAAAVRTVPAGAHTVVAVQMLLWIGALASGFVGNTPFALAMTPVVLELASSDLDLDIAVLAWALNFGACFGGNMTPIGSGANVIAFNAARRSGSKTMTFSAWLARGSVVVLVTTVVADAYLILRYCL